MLINIVVLSASTINFVKDKFNVDTFQILFQNIWYTRICLLNLAYHKLRKTYSKRFFYSILKLLTISHDSAT